MKINSKKTVYVVKRNRPLNMSYDTVAVYMDKKRAQDLADSFGKDEEWVKYGSVVEVPLIEDNCLSNKMMTNCELGD